MKTTTKQKINKSLENIKLGILKLFKFLDKHILILIMILIIMQSLRISHLNKKIHFLVEESNYKAKMIVKHHQIIQSLLLEHGYKIKDEDNKSKQGEDG